MYLGIHYRENVMIVVGFRYRNCLARFTIRLLLGLLVGSLVLWGDAVAEAELKPCRPGKVTYEGGAIACPACKDAATDFQPDPQYSDEVNGHMRKAMADDLESAKWLMAYFSDPGHKDYIEAKKWFGRALGIGALGADLKLSGGYDEPFLVTAVSRIFPLMSVRVISSCDQVNAQWQPLCYSQQVSFFITDESGNRKSSTQLSRRDFIRIANPQFREHHIVLSSLKLYEWNQETLMVLVSKNAIDVASGRYDYFLLQNPSSSDDPTIDAQAQVARLKPVYLGSNQIDTKLYSFYAQASTPDEENDKGVMRSKNCQFTLRPQQQKIIDTIMRQGDCTILDVKPYPASAR